MKLSPLYIAALLSGMTFFAACGHVDKDPIKSDIPAADDGKTDDGKTDDGKADEEALKAKREKECLDQGGKFEYGSCSIPLKELTDEQKCATKGSDFEWTNGKCVEIQGYQLTGEISPLPGVIWVANGKTCTKETTTTGERFQNCKAIDLSMPLATLANSNVQIKIDMTFDCDALTGGSVTLEVAPETEDGDASVGTGFSLHQSIGAGPSRFTMTVSASAGRKPVLKIKSDDLGYILKPDCKIVLLENSATAR